jgi:hypothetical protein
LTNVRERNIAKIQIVLQRKSLSFENDLRMTHYRKARKNYRCAIGGKIIRKGEIYISAHGI